MRAFSSHKTLYISDLVGKVGFVPEHRLQRTRAAYARPTVYDEAGLADYAKQELARRERMIRQIYRPIRQSKVDAPR